VVTGIFSISGVTVVKFLCTLGCVGMSGTRLLTITEGEALL
jgi:hypothetical protein